MSPFPRWSGFALSVVNDPRFLPRLISVGRASVRPDLVCALVAVILGSVITWHAYAQVVAHVQPGVVLVDNLPGTYSTYAVTYRDVCVARVSTEVARGTQEDRQLNMYVRFRLQFEGRQKEFRAHLQGDFNPLHQFVDGKLSLSGPEFSLEARAHEVNPISLSVDAPTPALPLPPQLSIPGPLLLRPHGEDLYRLEYAAFRSGMLGMREPQDSVLRPFFEVADDVIAQLHFSAERRETNTAGEFQPIPCNGTSEGWLDITDIFGRVLRLASGYFQRANP